MPTSTADHLKDSEPPKTGFWSLTLGSVGIVYGDIGTSPLYAIKESLTAARAGTTLTLR